MTTTDDVIKHYRRKVRDLTKREPHRPHRLNPQDAAAAKKFLSWCDARMVDPMRLIDLRFEQVQHVTRRRQAGPRLSDLCSESLVPYARREEAREAAADTQLDNFDQTVRDLTRMTLGHEQVRRRYYFQQQQELCVENPMSGGYDPRSHFCPNCPQAEKCATQLNDKWRFDVVSLRMGKIERMPDAVRKALRGWDGSVSV